MVLGLNQNKQSSQTGPSGNRRYLLLRFWFRLGIGVMGCEP